MPAPGCGVRRSADGLLLLLGAGMAMAYKLIEAAQSRWRAVNAPHLVALVRADALFHKGKLLERPVDITPEPAPDTPTSEFA